MRQRTSRTRSSLREHASDADWSDFNATVSLHAHTNHSCEEMSDLPGYISQIPLVASFFARELRERVADAGGHIDFSKGWWHPPVGSRTVFESEERQIESRFGLRSIVSITDHDNIEAGWELQQRYAAACAPVSFEWTVPTGGGYFHLGVHNLPPRHAREWFDRLTAHTLGRSREKPRNLVSELSRVAGVLLVLNHPLWDLANVGAGEHLVLLRQFLDAHGPSIHAVELNGYRSREENSGARRLSLECDLPIISGGDRHACEPNAIVNVTRAATFAEFADEVRAGVSHVVIMPEYRRSLAARKLAAAYEVLRYYRAYPPGRQRWTDRVSCEWRGTVRPLSYYWPTGGPLWVRSAVATFRIVTSPAVLPLVRVAFDSVPESVSGSPIPVGAAIETSTGVFRL